MTRVQAVANTRFGRVRQIYATGSGYSTHRGTRLMTTAQGDGVRAWAQRRPWITGVSVQAASERPFLVLKPGAAWPTNTALLRGLNAVGRGRGLRIVVISGLRTPREAWELRQRYLSGTGNLAARCCTRYTGPHTWNDCGKNPQSNHADGNAADVNLIMPDGTWLSLAKDRRARRLCTKHGIWFPVTSELWHAEAM